MKEVPIWNKYLLTIEEAAAYFRIGEKKLRQITEENIAAPFVLMNGNRVLIKRHLLEEYIDAATVV